MKFLFLFGSAVFFISTMPKVTLPYAMAKSQKKTSSKNPVNYRKISSEDINNRLKNQLSTFLGSCDDVTLTNLSQKLSLFEEYLNKTEQLILYLKDNFHLSLKDRILLNSILTQIQELPYKAVIKENIEPYKKVSVLKNTFEHNYRYSHNIDETKKVTFPWWAQIIFDSLLCMARVNQ